jgi:hypothetical protein
MEEEALTAVIKGEKIQSFCRDGIEAGTTLYPNRFDWSAEAVRSRADTVIKQVLMEKAKADAITQAALDSMRR